MIDEDNGEYSTVLHYAVAARSMECVQALLNAGVDINQTTPIIGETVLHEALKYTGEDIAEFISGLIGHGAKTSIADHYGDTPFHHAMHFQYEDDAYQRLMWLTL